MIEIRDSKGQKYPGKTQPRQWVADDQPADYSDVTETIHEIVVELQRAVRLTIPSCSFFSSWEYKGFQDVLDGEMKSLARSGNVFHRQAEPLWQKDEEMLWASGVLGSSQSQQLLYTIFFMMGKGFALRSGEEHRNLKFQPNPQVTLQVKGALEALPRVHGGRQPYYFFY